jgi:hypothetical protein
MDLLPDELEEGLRAQERDRTDIPAARVALERALVWQFRSISRGLLADRLLHSNDLDDLGWWHQFRSQKESFPNLGEEPFSTDTLPEFTFMAESMVLDPERIRINLEKARKPFLDDQEATRAFKDRFKSDVVWGKIPPIQVESLPDLPIRVYDGVIPMWREGGINRQLVSLGSFFRLWFGNSPEMRKRRLLVELGGTPSTTDRSGMFVFGIARIPSCIGPALLFDFEREYAISPYAGSGSPGMTDGARIVMRRRIPFPQPVSATRCVLGHELQHINQEGPAGSDARLLSRWTPVWKQDFCLFFQRPDSLGRLCFSFEFSGIIQSHYSPLWRVLFPDSEDPEEHPLESLLSELQKEGLLVYDSKEQTFYCPLFEKGRTWLMT